MKGFFTFPKAPLLQSSSSTITVFSFSLPPDCILYTGYLLGDCYPSAIGVVYSIQRGMNLISEKKEVSDMTLSCICK